MVLLLIEKYFCLRKFLMKSTRSLQWGPPLCSATVLTKSISKSSSAPWSKSLLPRPSQGQVTSGLTELVEYCTVPHSHCLALLAVPAWSSRVGDFGSLIRFSRKHFCIIPLFFRMDNAPNLTTESCGRRSRRWSIHRHATRHGDLSMVGKPQEFEQQQTDLNRKQANVHQFYSI